MPEYVNGDLKFEKKDHRYSVYKDGDWYNPPSFSKIKGQLKGGWEIKYGAKCATNYFIDTILPLVISGNLKLTEDDLLSEAKDGLLRTAKSQPDIHSKGECDIGTDVHNANERFVLTGEKSLGLSTGAENAFNSFHKWHKANKGSIGKTYLTEVPMYCESLDFCFTPDWVLEFNGTLQYIDYKSSAKLYKEDNVLQCAAYIYGMEELIEAGKLEQYGLFPGMKFETGNMLWLDKLQGFIARRKDYKPWLEAGLMTFVQLRDLFSLRKDFNAIKGLSY